MKISSITISERASYERTSNFAYKARITLKGGSTHPADINIDIPEDVLEPIVGIIQQAVANAMSKAAAEFHQEVQAALMGPAIEQEVIGHISDEEISF